MAIPPVPPLPNTDTTSLASADFNQTLRINQVFDALVNLLGVLQNVAIAQSENLNFLSTWQQAYTDLMGKVPVFTAASSIFGGTTSLETNTRDDVNRINSTYLEQLRSENQIVSDNAKTMNSNISQTNDEVTQFGNMATAFLEELSTVLSTVYH